jgi:hypothetical protein
VIIVPSGVVTHDFIGAMGAMEPSNRFMAKSKWFALPLLPSVCRYAPAVQSLNNNLPGDE